MLDAAQFIKSYLRYGATVFDVGGVGPGNQAHLVYLRRAFEEQETTRYVVDIQEDANIRCDLDKDFDREVLLLKIEATEGPVTVYIGHTLDHLQEPFRVVESCLTADQLIIVHGNPYSPIFRRLEKRQRNRGHGYGHLYNWSRESMAEMLCRAGWTVIVKEWLACGKWHSAAHELNIGVSICPSKLAMAYGLVAVPSKVQEQEKYGVNENDG